MSLMTQRDRVNTRDKTLEPPVCRHLLSSSLKILLV